MPDGTWEFADYADEDSVEANPCRLKLTLTITGEGARPVDPSEWSTTPSYPANGSPLAAIEASELLTFPGVEAPGLEVGAVRGGRELAVLALGRDPRLAVELALRGQAEVPGRRVDDAEPLRLLGRRRRLAVADDAADHAGALEGERKRAAPASAEARMTEIELHKVAYASRRR